MNDQTQRERILAIIEEMQYRTSAASTLEEMRDIRAKYGQLAAWAAAGIVASDEEITRLSLDKKGGKLNVIQSPKKWG